MLANLSKFDATSWKRSNQAHKSKNFLQYTYLAKAFHYLIFIAVHYQNAVQFHADKLDLIYQPYFGLVELRSFYISKVRKHFTNAIQIVYIFL